MYNNVVVIVVVVVVVVVVVPVVVVPSGEVLVSSCRAHMRSFCLVKYPQHC